MIKLAIYNELGIKFKCKAVSVLRNLDATRLRKANIAAQEMTREARIAKKRRKLALEDEEEAADDPQYGAGMF
ncbi:hypothetical protein J6590_025688 [Homalodisca vitripennis]|nr:hypothetical protein J6590_025688 [Homalodisca vitripennis]